MKFKLIQFDALLIQLLRCNSLEKSLSLIIRDMEIEFDFQSTGIFTLNRTRRKFTLRIGRNLSHQFRKTHEYSFDSPFISRLSQFGIVESSDPEVLKFECDHSHVVIVPLHFADDLLGFVFMDRLGGSFSRDDIIKLDMFASLISMVLHIFEQQHLIEQMTLRDSFTGLYNLGTFIEQGRHRLARARRYKRDMSLVVLKVANYDKVFRTIGNFETKKLMLDIADILKQDLRAMEIAGLLYPDTFGFVLEDTLPDNNPLVIHRIEEKIRRLSEYFTSSSLAWGICVTDEETRDFEVMLKHAQAASFDAIRNAESNIVEFNREEAEDE